eukprot:1130228-Pleurochrysis_carterae.AAC.3
MHWSPKSGFRQLNPLDMTQSPCASSKRIVLSRPRASTHSCKASVFCKATESSQESCAGRSQSPLSTRIACSFCPGGDRSCSTAFRLSRSYPVLRVCKQECNERSTRSLQRKADQNNTRAGPDQLQAKRSQLVRNADSSIVQLHLSGAKAGRAQKLLTSHALCVPIALHHFFPGPGRCRSFSNAEEQSNCERSTTNVSVGARGSKNERHSTPLRSKQTKRNGHEQDGKTLEITG